MKKILIILLVTILSPLSLVASETPEQLQDGVLTIGTDCGYAPFSFINSEDSDTAVKVSGSQSMCDGYDVMIAQNLADQFDVDLEIKLIAFDGLIPALNSGQIDMIVAGMSNTPERSAKIDFTKPYHESGLELSLVVASNSPYASANKLTDFSGGTFSSQLGTFHGDFLPQIPGIEIADPMEGFDGLMQSTQNGVIDGYINETAAAIEQTEGNDKLTYVELPQGKDGLQVSEEYQGEAIGIKKDSDQFLSAVNDGLDNIGDSKREKYMEVAKAKADGSYVAQDNFLIRTWNLFSSNKSIYLEGLKVTLLLAVFGTFFGTLIGLILVGLRIQEVHYKDKSTIRVIKKVCNIVAIVYIDIVRGTPMMVQAMLFFYGIAANIMSPNVAGAIIISLNTGAYIAEILRSGIQSIDKGQFEAAWSLGMTNVQTFIHVVGPQTLKNSLPALGNELIVNVKDSSVLSVIAVSELFYSTKQAASSGYMYSESYFIAAIFYLIITMVLTRLLNYIVKKYLGSSAKNEISMQNIEEVVSYDSVK